MSRPEIVAVDVSSHGRLYLRCTAGGPGDVAHVVLASHGPVCLRGSCLGDKSQGIRCVHARAAAEYATEHAAELRALADAALRSTTDTAAAPRRDAA